VTPTKRRLSSRFFKASAALALGVATVLGSVESFDPAASLTPMAGPQPAQAATSSLRITYAARLAGIRIGTGVLSANLESGRYTATISAQTSSVGRLVSQGQGEAVARGVFGRTVAVPVSYDLSASEENLTNVVRMRLSRGSISELSAQPPLSDHPNRVAVTRQHIRDVVDPVSALLMPVPNAASAMGPAACARTLPLFDGRQRYDIAMSFVRMETVPFGNGQAAVCRIRYQPIAGHRDNRRVNQDLAANTNMYVWLAQVGDEALVAPVRIEIGLDFGTLSVEALDWAAQ